MNNWSDIQDLKKKKALLDEKYIMPDWWYSEDPHWTEKELTQFNQPGRKEDGDKKDSQVITRCSYRITEPTSL